MKKIIALAVTSLLMVSSTFALGLSIGAKGNLGTTVSNDWAEVGTDLKGLSMNSEFDGGFGAYVNVGIVGGLGVQVEADVTKSTIQFKGASTQEAIDSNNWETKNFDSWLVDVPVMLWGSLDFWKFNLGFGVGPNFSFNLDATDRASFEAAGNYLSKVYTDKLYTLGLALGVDGKFYITDNFAIVASGRYIGNFEKTTATYPIEGGEGIDYPWIEFKRNSLYGGVGVELKLF